MTFIRITRLGLVPQQSGALEQAHRAGLHQYRNYRMLTVVKLPPKRIQASCLAGKYVSYDQAYAGPAKYIPCSIYVNMAGPEQVPPAVFVGKMFVTP